MPVKVEPGQIWEEKDGRRTEPRRFLVVEFNPEQVSCGPTSYVGCVRFFGLKDGDLLPHPKSGWKPRRFVLNLGDFQDKRFRFTGDFIEVPKDLGSYPPTKSYGL